MKSSVPIAISLTLLMLLLVLSAAFVFLFQGQMALHNELAETEQTLQNMAAQSQLEIDAAYSTQTVAADALATFVSSNVTMEAQLVNSQQKENDYDTQIATLSANIATAEIAIKQLEAQEPIIHIIKPKPNSTFQVGEQVEIIVSVSDIKGVKKVSIEVGPDSFEDIADPAQQSILAEHIWSAVGDGPTILTVKAENEISVSEPVSIPLLIIAPTLTPTPTATATEEPPTSTSTP